MEHQYVSTTTRWSSNSLGKAQGVRNTVTIANGKGYKLQEILGKQGKTVKRTRKHLQTEEINSILKGKFVPGFWSNCRSVTNHTRKRS
jgi:DNA polymerase II large subunit